MYLDNCTSTVYLKRVKKACVSFSVSCHFPDESRGETTKHRERDLTWLKSQINPNFNKIYAWYSPRNFIFRHLFSKLNYWQPFEAHTKKFENTKHISKIPLHGWWASKNWFLDTKKIFVLALFGSFFTYHGSKKWPEPKKLLTWKITFFMPVNHVKEYLIYDRTFLGF